MAQAQERAKGRVGRASAPAGSRIANASAASAKEIVAFVNHLPEGQMPLVLMTLTERKAGRDERAGH